MPWGILSGDRSRISFAARLAGFGPTQIDRGGMASWRSRVAAFAARSKSKSRAGRKRWAIAIANPASWSASPVNAFSLWKPDSVKVTKGADAIGMFAKTPMSERQFCKTCGGHLMANHPPLGMVDVYYATIPGLDFKADAARELRGEGAGHQGRIAKMKDFPKEFSRSGGR